MQVKEIMTGDVAYCGPQSALADAAMLMWHKDCGSVPVVNHEGKVVGIITDRDICMAVVTRDRLASQISVGEVIGGLVRVCSPDDDVEAALATMRYAQIRRLPVVDRDGSLCGILSICDALQCTGKDEKKSKRVSRKKVLQTLRAISQSQTVATNKEQVETDEDDEIEALEAIPINSQELNEQQKTEQVGGSGSI